MKSKNKKKKEVEFLDKKEKSSKKNFIVSSEMKLYADRVIQEKHIDIFPAKILYLIEYPNISKTIAGKIIKTSKEFKFINDYDYVIKVSGELWDKLEKDVKKKLIEHELRHCLVVNNDKTGEWMFKIRQHDIQDFSPMIKEYGIDWLKVVKLSISSIYDLTPAEEDNIKI